MLFFFYAVPFFTTAQQKNYPPSPDKVYGQLFRDVQMQQVFADQKTFPDCTPKRKIAAIMYDYGLAKGPAMDLKKFIDNNFMIPPAPPQINYIQQEKDLVKHANNLWGVLSREADVSPRWEGNEANGMSRLALPYPYVISGGAFSEVHYADSYFMLLGLKASKDVVRIENMVKNFDYLIYNYGHVPEGARTYYLSRSGLPVFCMMVDMLASLKGKYIYKKYLPSLLKEYDYWMDGSYGLKNGTSARHVVRLQSGEILNRYWDDAITPRCENYKQDTETADTAALDLAMLIKVASEEKLQEILNDKKEYTYRNLRAAAESGWEQNERWLKEDGKLSAIQTTAIIPVDLNALMYNMETVIAAALKVSGKKKQASLFMQKAAARKKAILKYCWNAEKGFFVDYNFEASQQQETINAAGLFPLFVKLATNAQAAAVVKMLEKNLLKPGGIAASVRQGNVYYATAPMQWIAYMGLRNYNQQALAKNVVQRWTALVEKTYSTTGRLKRMYPMTDVEPVTEMHSSTEAFGTTNAVYLAMKQLYK